MNEKRHDYLKRLPSEYYQGRSYVHWSLAMENRQTGWLVPICYYKFREILTHTAFRFGLCCPVYYCMPDHIHLLWMGILNHCDQRIAMRYFRRQLNPELKVFEEGYWERFWRIYSHLLASGLQAGMQEASKDWR